MAGFTKKKQALHDIMADTLVIKKAERARKWVTAIPVILSGIIVLSLIGLIFLELKPLSTEEPDSTITASAPKDSTSKEHPFLTYLRKKERGELDPLYADIDKNPLPPEKQTPLVKGWKLYATNEFGYNYFNEGNITRPSKNMVRVWAKSFFTDKGVISMVGQLGRRYENLSHDTSLWEVNCSEKKWRFLTATAYSKNGDVLSSGGEEFEWRFIVPGTVSDLLLKEVCE